MSLNGAGHFSGTFLAVDMPDTHIFEDAFSYTKRKGRKYDKETLAIVATVPATGVTVVDANVRYHVQYLIERLIGNSSVCMVNFLSPTSKLNSSLSSKKTRNAMFVSFSLQAPPNRSSIKLEETLGYSSQIKISNTTYDDFLNLYDVESLAAFLDKLLLKYQISYARAFGSYERTKVEMGVGHWIIRIICDLYNQSCINECRKLGVPFYSFTVNRNNGQLILLVNPSIATFNKPLRDIFSYWNAVNLFNYLTRGEIIYTKDKVVESLAGFLRT